MIFYILANQITALFININLLTTLSFDSEIVSYIYGGAQEEVYFNVTNKGRTLAIKPIQKGSYSNLLIITKENKYYFNLNYSEDNSHQFIEVKDGQINKTMHEKYSSNEFRILEGDSSSMLINNQDKSIMVNEVSVTRKQYLGKGMPIIVNGKRILN